MLKGFLFSIELHTLDDKPIVPQCNTDSNVSFIHAFISKYLLNALKGLLSFIASNI